MPQTIEVLVDGGKANAGPPLGPALGPLGLNIGEVVATINDKTKAFVNMKVPVKVIIDEKTKKFDIKVGTPPTSALIKKELGLNSGSGNARTDKVGDMTIDQIKKVAEMKQDSLLGADVKAMVLEVAGTCVSMGINVDGKDAKIFQADVHAGAYDEALSA